MAKYKQLSIPTDDYAAIEELMQRFNARNNADLSPPKIVLMAVRRVLADMGSGDER